MELHPMVLDRYYDNENNNQIIEYIHFKKNFKWNKKFNKKTTLHNLNLSINSSYN